MIRARKFAAVLTVAVLVCAVLGMAAFAAETGSVWVTVERGEKTAAMIVTDTTVTDGVVKLTYDSTSLTYESVEVAEGYVAMHAVNAEEAGTVLISWVAPEAYEMKDEAVCLMTVHFSGSPEEAGIILTGTAHDASGSEVAFADAPDTAALEEAIKEAEAVKEKDYTADSYAELKEALEEAKAVLVDPTATQAEVDEAEAAVKAAIAALEKKQETTTAPSESATTTPPTTEKQDPNGSAPTGDESNVVLFIILGAASILGVVALVILMVISGKKDKKKAKAPKTATASETAKASESSKKPQRAKRRVALVSKKKGRYAK